MFSLVLSLVLSNAVRLVGGGGGDKTTKLSKNGHPHKIFMSNYKEYEQLVHLTSVQLLQQLGRGWGAGISVQGFNEFA